MAGATAERRQRDLLTTEARIDTLRDYLAALRLSSDFPNTGRHAALRSQHSTYVTALAEVLTRATEAVVWGGR